MTDILINNSFGKDDTAKASVPFIVGGASAARDGQTAMFLTHGAIYTATKGGNEGVRAEGFAPLEDLVQGYIGNGGILWVCKACADAKGVTADDLIEGAEIAGAGHILGFLDNGGQMLM
ncbi:MAG: DsrE family protein [Marinosulfonomonas sp.]|nr:DsrE family protein [Marinosulfonomonas sp.]